MNQKKVKTTQEWLPFEKILNNGIFIYKNNYIKIIKVTPINYDLKSNLEKEAILNSYKLYLKTCDFDFQILIQSKKENLKKHIMKIKEEQKNEENKKISKIYQDYIEYINNLNNENKSSSKNFYILIKYINEKNTEENIINNILNEKYFKIKECLSRCGNNVSDISNKDEIKSIFNSFYNCRKNTMKQEGENIVK